MNGDLIPDTDNVVRALRRTDLDHEGEVLGSGLIDGWHPEPDGFSVNWLEFYGLAQLDALIAILLVLRSKRNVKQNQQMAIISLDKLSKLTAERQVQVQTIHAPEQNPPDKHNDPSHVLMKAIPASAHETQVKILVELVAQSHCTRLRI